MQPGAVVLCGGRSRRMGSPKAWLPFGPEVLLQRVVRLVGDIARPVVVVRAPGQDLPPLPADVRVATDAVADRGPLQGLAAGLSALPAGVELAYATATDIPFIEHEWIRCLVDRLGAADLAIPRVGGHLQPLAALYRRSPALAAIEPLLDSGGFGVRHLAERLRTVVLTEDDLRGADPRMRTAWSINSPEEYREALELAGLRPPSGATLAPDRPPGA